MISMANAAQSRAVILPRPFLKRPSQAAVQALCSFTAASEGGREERGRQTPRDGMHGEANLLTYSTLDELKARAAPQRRKPILKIYKKHRLIVGPETSKKGAHTTPAAANSRITYSLLAMEQSAFAAVPISGTYNPQQTQNNV
jgi:hypothetical protein